MKQTENENFIDEFNNLAEGDFVFIVDDQGSLKTILVPEEYDDVPNNVKKIFRIFGIKSLANQTLH